MTLRPWTCKAGRAGEDGPAGCSPPWGQAVGSGAGASRRRMGPCPPGRGCSPRVELCPLGLCRRCSCPQLQCSRLQRKVARWGGSRGELGTRIPTPLATLTLGSKEYSIAWLVAVGLAIVLGAERGVSRDSSPPVSPQDPSPAPTGPGHLKAITRSTQPVERAGPPSISAPACLHSGHQGAAPSSGCHTDIQTHPCPHQPAPGPPLPALTSACPPGVSVFPQRSQRRQGRCQSLPREVTFSAGRGRDGEAGDPPGLTPQRLLPATVTHQSRPSCYSEDTCWAPP